MNAFEFLAAERAAEQHLRTTAASDETVAMASTGTGQRWTRQTPPLASINLDASNMPIYTFTMPDNRREYDLSPSYQRGSVWTTNQQIDLIRSLMMSLPVGVIICATQPDSLDAYYKVVDGKQRIEAIHAFRDDQLAVPADWFPDEHLNIDDINPDGTATWSTLTEVGQRVFQNLSIPIATFDPTTEWVQVEPGAGTTGSNNQFITRRRTPTERIVFEAEVFGLINATGTAQTAADLANAAAIAETNRRNN